MQRALVEQAQAGDLDAFTRLVKAYAPRLHGIANLILRDSDRAQDAVQDALLMGWRDIRALRDRQEGPETEPGRGARDARSQPRRSTGRIG